MKVPELLKPYMRDKPLLPATKKQTMDNFISATPTFFIISHSLSITNFTTLKCNHDGLKSSPFEISIEILQQ